MNVCWFLACVLSLLACASAVAEEPKAPPVNPELLAREREALVSRLWTMVNEFQGSPDDALFLEGTLANLAAGEGGPLFRVNRLESLRRLAERQWRAPRDETAVECWTRQQRDLDFVPGERVAQYREFRNLLQEFDKRYVPQDWRTQTEFWQDLFITLHDSKAKANLAEVWRDKIRADEKHEDLYRRAYVAATIAAKANLDFELIRPILEPKIPQPADELLHVAEVLYMLALSKCPFDDPRRVELRSRISKLPIKPDLRPVERSYLVRLDSVGGEEQRVLRSALVRALIPRSFRHFAALAEIPPETVRRLQLSRETNVVYHGLSLRAVLSELQSAVDIPLWIDDAVVASDETPIFLEETGPWLAILERVLSQSKFSLAIRPSGEFWIGAPDRKAAAFATWDRGLVKATGEKGKLRDALHDPTTLEFIRTPLRDVVDYLSDLHGVPCIHRPTALANVEITAIRRDMPLYLALELLAEETNLSWDALGQVLVFGTPAEIERLRQFEARRLRLFAELTGRNCPTREKLLGPTTMEFTEKPLVDVCAYLSDLHKLPVAVAAGESSRRKFTLHMKNVELGAALDIAALDLGLLWSSDGEAIYIGSNDEVTHFLKLRKSREGKRAKYTAEVGAKMKLPIKVRLDDVPLSKAAPALSELIGLPVELSADDTELGKTPVRVSFAAAPADVMLDLLCLAHGLAWETTDKGVVIKRGKR